MDFSRRKVIVLVFVGWDARIYTACCWSEDARGLDGNPLSPAS
jgi:hypothetical protein